MRLGLKQLLVVMLAAGICCEAQAEPRQLTSNETSWTFETGDACNESQTDKTGKVRFKLDRFGSVLGRSRDGNREDACFSPAVPVSENSNVEELLYENESCGGSIGGKRTIWDSMPFLCYTKNGNSQGEWLDSRYLASSSTITYGDTNSLESSFTYSGIKVQLAASLVCTVLTECWTFTNNTNSTITELALIHYIDGDLYFPTDQSFAGRLP